MFSYTFDQLDERGQANAINLYLEDAQELFEEATHGPQPIMIPSILFSSWRFTIHGERIA